MVKSCKSAGSGMEFIRIGAKTWTRASQYSPLSVSKHIFLETHNITIDLLSQEHWKSMKMRKDKILSFKTRILLEP